MTMTPTTRPPNSGVCVGIVPAVTGTLGLAASEPPIASAGMIRKNRPISIARALGDRVPLGAGALVGERRAVVVGRRGEVVEHLGQAVGARAGDVSRRLAAPPTRRRRPAARTAWPGCTASRSFISAAWIFLPRYSGVRPTISPAMNTASRAIDQACPSGRRRRRPARPRRASCAASATIPPSGVNESCMQLTAPVDVPVVDAAHSPHAGGAEADLLALHVAARLRASRSTGRRRAAVRFGLPFCSANIVERREHDQDPRHHGEQHPGLRLVADQYAERRRRARTGSAGARRSRGSW